MEICLDEKRAAQIKREIAKLSKNYKKNEAFIEALIEELGKVYPDLSPFDAEKAKFLKSINTAA